jgi:hypothetical protein
VQQKAQKAGDFCSTLFHECFFTRVIKHRETTSSIIKHHETSSNKITRKSHRVDGPYDAEANSMVSWDG